MKLQETAVKYHDTEAILHVPKGLFSGILRLNHQKWVGLRCSAAQIQGAQQHRPTKSVRADASRLILFLSIARLLLN